MSSYRFPNIQSTTTNTHQNETLRRFDNPTYEETTHEKLITVEVPSAQSSESHIQETGPTYEAIAPSAASNKRLSKDNAKINGKSSTRKDNQIQGL